jgi:hypothetical protein
MIRIAQAIPGQPVFGLRLRDLGVGRCGLVPLAGLSVGLGSFHLGGFHRRLLCPYDTGGRHGEEEDGQHNGFVRLHDDLYFF